MEHCPEARVVKLDSNSDVISVLEQHKMAVAGVDDLLRLLTSR